jgi:hypothetical protein
VLQNAYRHKDAAHRAMLAALDEPRCLYFVRSSWVDWANLEAAKEEWHRIQRVSVGHDGVLHGWLAASVDRDVRAIEEISALSFRPGSLVWARDLRDFFGFLLLGQFHRIGWSVSVGNPAEAMYDRIVERLGGRVCGRQREIDRNRLGGLVDRKLYEVFPSEIPDDVFWKVCRPIADQLPAQLVVPR